MSNKIVLLTLILTSALYAGGPESPEPQEMQVLNHEVSPGACAICLDNEQRPRDQIGLVFMCLHRFHKNCIEQRQDCPICRGARCVTRPSRRATYEVDQFFLTGLDFHCLR